MSGLQTAGDYAAALRAANDDYREGRITVREHLHLATALWSEILARGLVDEVQAELDQGSDG